MGKIDLILKVGVVISLLILFLSLTILPKEHCSLCEFEMEGEVVSGSDFMEEYFEVCINPYVKKDSYRLEEPFNVQNQ